MSPPLAASTAVPPRPLRDCIVLLLGGTAGVGLEAACRFAEVGVAGICLLGRDRDRGRRACDSVRERHRDASPFFVAVDATRQPAVAAAVAEARSRLGRIDVLVTSTGPSRPPRLLRDITGDEVQPTLDGLILPPLLTMHAVLPLMCEQGSGVVVNVASDAAKVATAGETLIGAAMAAILMFSRAAAMEVKRNGVRINVLTPSLIANTPGATLIAGDPFSARMFEKAARLAHLGVAEPEDLADSILFLAGPASRRITGQALSVNGGISAA